MNEFLLRPLGTNSVHRHDPLVDGFHADATNFLLRAGRRIYRKRSVHIECHCIISNVLESSEYKIRHPGSLRIAGRSLEMTGGGAVAQPLDNS